MGENFRIACPLCGSGKHHTRLGDGPVRVVKCADCGVAWRQGGPPDTPPVISTWEAGTIQISSASGCDGPPLRGLDASLDLRPPPHIGLGEAEQINELKRPPGTLLNVGSDAVDFLENAKLCGWNCTSVFDIAGLPQMAALWPTEFGDLDEAGGSGGYDVVRLEGIMDRSRDPVALLKRAAPLHAQNGLLVVSAVDFGDFDFPLYGEGASLSRPDLPRWFFTPKSLGLVLRRAGYSIIRLKSSSPPRHLSLFARRSLRAQYRGLRQWIDSTAPGVRPQPRLLTPA